MIKFPIVLRRLRVGDIVVLADKQGLTHPDGRKLHGFIGRVQQIHKFGKDKKYRVRVETNHHAFEVYLDRSELWKVIK